MKGSRRTLAARAGQARCAVGGIAPARHGRTVRRSGWVLAAACALAASGAWAGAPSHPAALRKSITLDGAFVDWWPVLASPANTVLDGTAAGVPCPSDDADCAATVTGDQDLRRAAWTYDASSLFFYLERQQAAAGTSTYLIFLDENANGRMESSERVLRVDWSATGGIVVSLVRYAAVNASQGDPIAPGGTFDGASLPGTVTNIQAGDSGAPPACATCGSSDGLAAELGVPWAALRTGGITPRGVGFLVASSVPVTTQLTLGPSDLRDHSGGTTLVHGTRVDATSASVHGLPGDTVEMTFRVTQGGNAVTGALGGEPLELRARSEGAMPLEIWRDSTGAGGVELAFDANGDGDFDDPADHVFVDADADGKPDTGVPLAAGASRTFVVRTTVPAGTEGLVDHVRLEAFPPGHPEDFESDTTALHVGPIALETDSTRTAAPGGQALHPFAVWNLGAAPELVNLKISGMFSRTLVLDAGGGTPGAALPDSDGEGHQDVLVAPGASVSILDVVSVPPAAVAGQPPDVTVLRAYPVGGPEAETEVKELTQVQGALGLTELADSTTPRGVQSVLPGGLLWLPHVVVNSNPAPQDVTLTASVVTGNLVSPVILLDPNGDGLPDDATPVPATLTLPGGGGSVAFLVVSALPQGDPVGAAQGVQVRASRASDALTTNLTDRAVAASAVATVTATHEVQAPAYGPCDVAHVELVAAARSAVTVDWTDPTGALQSQAATSDARGRARVSRPFASADPVGSWSAATGASTASFNLESDVVVEVLNVAWSADYSYVHVATRIHDAQAVAALRGLRLETNLESGGVVRGAAGGFIGVSDGTTTRLVNYDGVLTTRTRDLPPIPAGGFVDDGWAVRGAQFPPNNGQFHLMTHVIDACGDEIATGDATVDVPDMLVDTDGDFILDMEDNCPTIPNTDQTDTDGDGYGDACDNCPTVLTADQADGDADGHGDACDDCPTVSNPDQADADVDGVGDVCDDCPAAPNTNQADGDGDRAGDVCDDCPSVPNPAQTDGDRDGVGDACDDCPTVADALQVDTDHDHLGDACDPCPTDPTNACAPPASLLRNASLTARSPLAISGLLTTGTDPSLDPVRDLYQAGVAGTAPLTITGDAAFVGDGHAGVIILYQLAGAAGPLRVSRSNADVVLTGF